MNEKIRITIIEDEALISESLKYTLEDLGYDVVNLCYNYNDALKTIHENKADLYIIDINLGYGQDKGGLMLAEHINLIKKPFIFLTAYSDNDTILNATHLRPNGYLIKPAKPASIFAGIQTAIENHQSKESEKTTQIQSVNPDYFFVKIGIRKHKLQWSNVYCLEAGKNYVKLHLFHTNAEYPIRGTLSFVSEELIPQVLKQDFIRINRSICINRNFITSYNVHEICCKTKCFENTKYSMAELQKLLEDRNI